MQLRVLIILITVLALGGCRAAIVVYDDECETPLTECAGECVDLETDSLNCGQCDLACATGRTCRGGECFDSGECSAGQVECSGECVELLTDEAHCGGCDAPCGPDEICISGVCTDNGNCSAGEVRCGDICVNRQTDDLHCGGCGIACLDGEVCSAGECLTDTCSDGETPCSGDCVDLNADPDHCGGCGIACSAGEVCFEGGCGLVCGEGQTNCDGRCTDTRWDPMNCGGCDELCLAPPGGVAVCVASECDYTCLDDFGDCNGEGEDGCETDLLTDADHCGACGTACTPGAHSSASCIDGECSLLCYEGYTFCGDDPADGCIDTDSDSTHCGGCLGSGGVTCPEGQECAAGECVEGGPSLSCLDIITAGRSTGDGAYTIDPDGAGGATEFTVYCDMTTDGGGWTLTYKIRSDISSSDNPWWNQVMPGAGTAFPTDISVPITHTQGPTLASRASLFSSTGSTEWRASTMRAGAIVFDVVSSTMSTGGQALRCFAAGTCSSAEQTCSDAATDGVVLTNTLGGPLSAGDSGYVCDVGWTDCDFCVDWSSVRTDDCAGCSTENSVRYVGDDSISLTDTTTFYWIR